MMTHPLAPFGVLGSGPLTAQTATARADGVPFALRSADGEKRVEALCAVSLSNGVCWTVEPRCSAVVVRDSATLRKLWAWRPKDAAVGVPTALCFAPCSGAVWAAWSDSSIRVFDAATRRVAKAVLPVTADPVSAVTTLLYVASSVDDPVVVCGARNGDVAVVHARACAQTGLHAVLAPQTPVAALRQLSGVVACVGGDGSHALLSVAARGGELGLVRAAQPPLPYAIGRDPADVADIVLAEWVLQRTVGSAAGGAPANTSPSRNQQQLQQQRKQQHHNTSNSGSGVSAGTSPAATPLGIPSPVPFGRLSMGVGLQETTAAAYAWALSADAAKPPRVRGVSSRSTSRSLSPAPRAPMDVTPAAKSALAGGHAADRGTATAGFGVHWQPRDASPGATSLRLSPPTPAALSALPLPAPGPNGPAQAATRTPAAAGDVRPWRSALAAASPPRVARPPLPATAAPLAGDSDASAGEGDSPDERRRWNGEAPPGRAAIVAATAPPPRVDAAQRARQGIRSASHDAQQQQHHRQQQQQNGVWNQEQQQQQEPPTHRARQAVQRSAQQRLPHGGSNRSSSAASQQQPQQQQPQSCQGRSTNASPSPRFVVVAAEPPPAAVPRPAPTRGRAPAAAAAASRAAWVPGHALGWPMVVATPTGTPSAAPLGLPPQPSSNNSGPLPAPVVLVPSRASRPAASLPEPRATLGGYGDALATPDGGARSRRHRLLRASSASASVVGNAHGGVPVAAALLVAERAVAALGRRHSEATARRFFHLWRRVAAELHPLVVDVPLSRRANGTMLLPCELLNAVAAIDADACDAAGQPQPQPHAAAAGSAAPSLLSSFFASCAAAGVSVWVAVPPAACPSAATAAGVAVGAGNGHPHASGVGSVSVGGGGTGAFTPAALRAIADADRASHVVRQCVALPFVADAGAAASAHNSDGSGGGGGSVASGGGALAGARDVWLPKLRASVAARRSLLVVASRAVDYTAFRFPKDVCKLYMPGGPEARETILRLDDLLLAASRHHQGQLAAPAPFAAAIPSPRSSVASGAAQQEKHPNGGQSMIDWTALLASLPADDGARGEEHASGATVGCAFATECLGRVFVKLPTLVARGGGGGLY